jgi:hypothetical protein
MSSASSALPPIVARLFRPPSGLPGERRCSGHVIASAVGVGDGAGVGAADGVAIGVGEAPGDGVSLVG